MFYINPNDLNFDGLKEAMLIFSKDEKLLAVLLKLPKHKFNNIYNSLSPKYQLVSKDIPFVGNKKVKFIDDNTEITLNAPHMSFDMDLQYISKDLWKTYKKIQQQEQEAKRKKEASQL